MKVAVTSGRILEAMSQRKRRAPEGTRLPTELALCCYVLVLGGSRGSLIDLLVARGCVSRTHGESRAGLLELEVISLRSVLDEIDLVLRVTGVTRTLDGR